MLLSPNGLTADVVQVIALALFVSWLIDRFVGEPSASWHPVVWMGQYLHFCGKYSAPQISSENAATRLSTAAKNARAFLLGAMFWLLAAIVLIGFALKLQHVIRLLEWYWQGIILAVLLKPLFSWQMLRQEVVAVELALVNSIDAGRQQLSRLVSRDVQQLRVHEVRESAIETLAENVNDSVISPLFWFVLAGLPGVLLYRFANTADAMWGYRGERGGRLWTWAGKWTAYADDVLSWPGARLTACMMYLSLARMPTLQLWREAGVTASPNGGWPMGAVALLLNIRLSKPGVYTLHANGSQVESQHIGMAVRLCERAICVWFVCVGLLLMLAAWY